MHGAARASLVRECACTTMTSFSLRANTARVCRMRTRSTLVCGTCACVMSHEIERAFCDACVCGAMEVALLSLLFYCVLEYYKELNVGYR